MSERFEGLNLPQLLDLMHELVVPEAVPWFPQTPGWWVLCGWALAVTALLIAEIVKRAALGAYPRARVAGLHGRDWARFLCESSGDDRQVTEAAESLASAAYRPDADGRALLQPARRWVRVHRA